MKLTIFGGTGGVGRHLVEQALEEGHEVTAVARDPARLPRHERLVAVTAELDDEEALRRALAGSDAVLSALGARKNTPDQVELFGAALERITRLMKEIGVRRLVAISGAGVLAPGDHVTFGRRLVRALLLLVAKHVARAKEREWQVITASDLDWVVVRAPRVLPGGRRGGYRVLPDRVPSPTITQGDVAELMLRCASSEEWVRKAPIVGY